MKIVASFLAVALCAGAADIPRTLVPEEEAEPIRSAIVRKEAWTLDSVRRLRVSAQRHMKTGPWSVTTDRPAGRNLDVHDYYSEAPYWWPNPDNPMGPYLRKEGQINPARFTANRTALNAMADAVFALGAAAYFLNDGRYAARAASLIHRWFLSPQTRMNPNLDYSQAIPGLNDGHGAGIVEGRAFIRTIQGMEFLAQSGYWNARQQTAVKKWFEDYLRWLTESPKADDEKHSGNNHATWWAAETAAVATFVDNQNAARAAFDFYRDRIFPTQIRPETGGSREEARVRPQPYSPLNLEPMTLLCRIAQVQGVDLWSIRARGVALATVVDSLNQYFADPRKWQKDPIPEFSNDSLYILALAGIGLKKPEYLASYRKLEHPAGAWFAIVDLLAARWELSSHQTRH